MQEFSYYQTSEGIHVIDSQDSRSLEFSINDVTQMLTEIQDNSDSGASYVLLNLEAHYHLPLGQIVTEFRHFYKQGDRSQLKIAMVVQSSMLNILEVAVKTLVARDSIHYFTMSARAYLWLNLERKRATF